MSHEKNLMFLEVWHIGEVCIAASTIPPSMLFQKEKQNVYCKTTKPLAEKHSTLFPEYYTDATPIV